MLSVYEVFYELYVTLRGRSVPIPHPPADISVSDQYRECKEYELRVCVLFAALVGCINIVLCDLFLYMAKFARWIFAAVGICIMCLLLHEGAVFLRARRRYALASGDHAVGKFFVIVALSMLFATLVVRLCI